MSEGSRAYEHLPAPGLGELTGPGAVPRFSGHVESDFRAWFYTNQMPRAQISLGLAQALVFITLGLDLVQRPDTAGRIATLIKLALICPLLLTTMWIARSPGWRRLFPRFMCASIIAVGVAFSVTNLGEMGFEVRYDVLVLVTVFTYFLGGLAPTFASATGLCLLGMHVFLSINRGSISLGETAYESLFLLAINAFGMINANQTERSVRQAFWHYRSMTQMAELDELTRLLNRRGFDRQYAELWQFAQRERQPLAIAFVDVDHFKNINDRYGHSTGDEALRQVAQALSACEPRPTLCARMGGDEFVLVWSGLSGREAEMLATSLPQGVEALKFRGEPGGPALLTVSVGLAVCEPDPLVQAAEGLRRADRVLYEAKRAGRNRISLE